MQKYIIITLLALLTLTSCGEYQRAQKSTDANYKLDFAKRAFEKKRYVQAATILQDVITVFKGTEKAEESLYLLALSNYEQRLHNGRRIFQDLLHPLSARKIHRSWPASTPDTDIISIPPIHSSIRPRQLKPSKSCRDFSTISREATKSR